MQALCSGLGMTYVHVLQPTLHDEGSKPLTAQELATGTDEEGLSRRVTEGYDLLRERGRELAEQGIAFLDLSMIFEGVEETLYFDRCHFEKPGSVMMAREVGRHVLEQLRSQ